MRLYAFQGLHYDFDAQDLPAGELVALPYDQIDAEARDRFHKISPRHFTHLTRPVPEGSESEYDRATNLHRQWLETGAITRDDKPAVYPYAIEYPDGARRFGVLALIGIEPPDSDAIRPHERTLAKPLADRLELLETMRVDLEPALFLSDDAGELDALVQRDADEGEPLIIHTDADGYRHVLYRVDDPERIRLYKDALGRGPGAVADGHHRYKVSREFATKHGVGEGEAASAKLAVVTSLESSALTIDPIHRALADTPDLDELASVAVERQGWEAPAGADAALSGRAFAEAVADAHRAERAKGTHEQEDGEPRPVLGVLLPDGTAEIWFLDPDEAPEQVSEGARQLAVVLLHEVIFADLGLTESNWTDGTVYYRHDPSELWRMVTSGEAPQTQDGSGEGGGGGAGVGFFLPHMDPSAFSAAIAEGDLLPPKSTRFLPKVMSGLAWADHESEVG